MLRQLFATHLLQEADEIRAVHELLGHCYIITTMSFTHVLDRGGKKALSLAGR